MMLMKLKSKKEIKKILDTDKPLKSLGQNFLIDQHAVNALIESGDLNDEDHVLEIGPGLGALTEEIEGRAGRVTAIEKDSRFINYLKNTINPQKTKLINADFLNLSPQKIEIENKVISNLPFSVATPIIDRLLTQFNFDSITVIVQKEVAKRIEGRKKESFLSIKTKFRGNPQFLKKIDRDCFWPRPRVDGAILKITPKQISTEEDFNRSFLKIIEAGFCHSRKQIKNNLTSLGISKKESIYILDQANIDPKKRAEKINLEDWRRITEFYLTLNLKKNRIK